MKFKNDHLESLGNLLFDLALKGKESRMRTRFIKIIDSHLQEVVNSERTQLINDYAEKDEDNEPVNDGKGNITLKSEYMDTFAEELRVLMDESLIVSKNEENKDMLLALADIILEGDFEVSGMVASLYDSWCIEFEAVKDNYKEENVK